MHRTTVYTTTCARAYKSRFRGAKGLIGRNVLSVHFSPSSHPPAYYSVCGGWEADPEPSLSF